MRSTYYIKNKPLDDLRTRQDKHMQDTTLSSTLPAFPFFNVQTLTQMSLLPEAFSQALLPLDQRKWIELLLPLFLPQSTLLPELWKVVEDYLGEPLWSASFLRDAIARDKNFQA